MCSQLRQSFFIKTKTNSPFMVNLNQCSVFINSNIRLHECNKNSCDFLRRFFSIWYKLTDRPLSLAKQRYLFDIPAISPPSFCFLLCWSDVYPVHALSNCPAVNMCDHIVYIHMLGRDVDACACPVYTDWSSHFCRFCKHIFWNKFQN